MIVQYVVKARICVLHVNAAYSRVCVFVRKQFGGVSDGDVNEAGGDDWR